LAFSSDGEMLATGAFDEGIKLWDARTLAQLPHRLSGQIGAVWSLAFWRQGGIDQPEGERQSGPFRLASGSRDMPIHLWDLTAASRPTAITNLNAAEFGNFAFSPDSKLIASGCKDNYVRVWKADTLEEVYRLRGVSYTVAFNRQGDQLLVADAAGAAYWWNFRDDTRLPVPSYDRLGEISSVELSGDRRIAAVGHKSGAIQLLEIDSGKLAGTYIGHRDAVLSLAFASDGRMFASGGKDKDIRLWDVAITNQSRQVCAEHKGGVAGLAISSDGRRMASGCNASTIKFWDLRHPNRSLGARSWHRSAIRTLAFSSDNERLASGSEDRSVKLWDFTTRRELASFEFDAAVKLVAFSPDSNFLAVITEKGSLHVLRATQLPEADRELQTFYAAK
jgi:WD40 repeat protein